MKKENIEVKQSRIEIIVVILLSLLITIAFFIQFLGLDEIKIVQIVTDLIISNFWNISVLIVLLIIIYLVKKKALQNEIEELNNEKESEKECEK